MIEEGEAVTLVGPSIPLGLDLQQEIGSRSAYYRQVLDIKQSSCCQRRYSKNNPQFAHKIGGVPEDENGSLPYTGKLGNR